MKKRGFKRAEFFRLVVPNIFLRFLDPQTISFPQTLSLQAMLDENYFWRKLLATQAEM